MAEQSPATKAILEDGKHRAEKIRADIAERQKGKPTPTQDENDRACAGEYIAKHEEDGSPEVDPVHQDRAKSKH